MKNHNLFRYFKTSPEIIRLSVMVYVRFPLSLRNVEDLLHERGVDICHETVRYWWNKFGPMFAREIHKKLMHPIANHSNWKCETSENRTLGQQPS
jgi:putative transposase